MSATKTRSRPRRAPQRTCVACGSTTAKRELVRLVRTAEGGVEPDPTGKRPGRGAYICRSADCWSEAVRRGRLEHSLRVKLTPEARESLLEAASELVEAPW